MRRYENKTQNKVAIVDDQEIIRETLNDLIDDLNITNLEIDNFSQYECFKPDTKYCMYILDHDIKVNGIYQMSGSEWMKKYDSQVPNHQRLLMTGGYPSNWENVTGRHLSKPFSLDIFYKMMDSIMYDNIIKASCENK